ncbi:MAG TPA: hypothetical protein VGE67_03075 [Haloferula sp.]
MELAERRFEVAPAFEREESVVYLVGRTNIYVRVAQWMIVAGYAAAWLGVVWWWQRRKGRLLNSSVLLS